MAVLHPVDVVHPADRMAKEHLEAIPLLQTLVRAYLKMTAERVDRFVNVNGGVRLGPGQFPDVYHLLPPVCAAFGIAEPELFLSGDEFNASTMGSTYITIAVGGGLLDRLDEDELRAILAHECGHIVADHVLYHSMAIHLAKGSLAGLLRWGGPVGSVAAMATGPLEAALMAWGRASELTADRAAVVYLGGAEPLIRGLLKIAGVPAGRVGSVDLDLLVAQAAEYDPLNRSMWDRLLQTGVMRGVSHPMLAVRVRETLAWAASDDCRRVQQAIRGGAALCTTCRASLDATWRFCLRCGVAVPARTAHPELERRPQLESTTDVCQ